MPKSTGVMNSLFDRKQTPLLIWDAQGVQHGYAVKHEKSDMPVLLDRGLERIELTPEERREMLAVIAEAEAAGKPPRIPGAVRSAFKRVFSAIFRVLFWVTLVVVLVGGYWFHYVLLSKDSYDSIGMDLNSIMPEVVNKWGCAKLQLRFGDKNAPYGCTAADYKSWK